MLRKITQQYYEREFQLGSEDVQELLDAAESTLAESLAALSDAFADGDDPTRIKEAAHALKGNLMNMGLAEQAEQALAIEQRIGSSTDQARASFKTLHSELMDF